jgi:hypothetical protein
MNSGKQCKVEIRNVIQFWMTYAFLSIPTIVLLISSFSPFYFAKKFNSDPPLYFLVIFGALFAGGVAWQYHLTLNFPIRVELKGGEFMIRLLIGTVRSKATEMKVRTLNSLFNSGKAYVFPTKIGNVTLNALYYSGAQSLDNQSRKKNEGI